MKKLFILLTIVLVILYLLFKYGLLELTDTGTQTVTNIVIEDCNTSFVNTLENAEKNTRILINQLCIDEIDEVEIKSNNIIIDGFDYSSVDKFVASNEQRVRNLPRSTIKSSIIRDAGQKRPRLVVPSGVENIAFRNINLDGIDLIIENGGVMLSNFGSISGGGLAIGSTDLPGLPQIDPKVQQIELGAYFHNRTRKVVDMALLEANAQPASFCGTYPVSICEDDSMPNFDPLNPVVTDSRTVKICGSVNPAWITVGLTSTGGGHLVVMGPNGAISLRGNGKQLGTREYIGMQVHNAVVSLWNGAGIDAELTRANQGDHTYGIYLSGDSSFINICGANGSQLQADTAVAGASSVRSCQNNTALIRSGSGSMVRCDIADVGSITATPIPEGDYNPISGCGHVNTCQ